ncbi:MAG TPA: class I SAM-dependent methyltransferase [Streptosporangiaceae bacterium]
MEEPEFIGRTRWSYDAAADDVAVWIRGELGERPVDRALLDGFAEVVRGQGPVADLGCGSGRVTAHLARLGVDVFGVDLSGGMVAAARRTYPGLRFATGSMLGLDIADGALGGVVAWFSVIHVPDERLPGVFGEFRRVLRPGGYALVAFQVGDGVEHRSRAGAHDVALDFHYRDPDAVAGLLERAGLAVRARTVRAPVTSGDYPEDTPQAFLLARREDTSRTRVSGGSRPRS